MTLINTFLVGIVVWTWIMAMQGWRTVVEYREKYEDEDQI